MAARQLYGDEYTDMIPSYYLAQCQQHMYLTGKEKEFVHVLIFPDNQDKIENQINRRELDNRDLSQWVKSLHEMGFLKQYVVYRSEKMIKIIKETGKIWEKKYIKEKTPPDPKEYNDFKVVFKNPSGECITTSEIRQKINVLHRIQDQSDKVNEYGKRLKKEILDYMLKNEVEGIEDKCRLLDKNGYVLATWNGKTLYLKRRKKKK
jgi:hypothetical protein